MARAVREFVCGTKRALSYLAKKSKGDLHPLPHVPCSFYHLSSTPRWPTGTTGSCLITNCVLHDCELLVNENHFSEAANEFLD
jgi:hypothetical protein